jgi:RHS repeat-associated protein
LTTPFMFGGQYLDAESGLYYLRARYYDPTTSQFLTLDPALSKTMSPYAYVSGNPLNGADPSGLDSNCSIFAFWANDWCAAEGAQTDTGKAVIAGGLIAATVVTGGAAGAALGGTELTIGGGGALAFAGGGAAGGAVVISGSALSAGAWTVIGAAGAAVCDNVLFGKTNPSGKERSSDRPSWWDQWESQNARQPGESSGDYARRSGAGPHELGPIKKWLDRRGY